MRLSRGLTTLTLATVVAVGVCAFAIDHHYQQATLQRNEGGLVFPTLKKQVHEIQRIDISRANGSFALKRSANGWRNTGIGGYPAKDFQVEQTIASIAGLKYLEAKTERHQLHHKLSVEDVNVDGHSTRLTLMNKQDAIAADIIVGNPREKDLTLDRKGVYIRLPAEQRAWLAEGSLDVRFNAVNWSDHLVVDIEASMLTALTVKHASGEVVALHRVQPTDTKLTLKNLRGGSTVKNQHQIDYMSGLLRDLTFSDARPTKQTGFTNSVIFEATAETNSRMTITLHVNELEEDGSAWTLIKATVSNDAQATVDVREEVQRINLDFAGWNVKLPRKFADRLKIRLQDIVSAEETGKSNSQE